MYFLHDTHHGTVFSTSSSVFWTKMEMKTCQFGNILDSATRSTSCRWFFEIRIDCVELPTLLPFKPIILTPPENIVDNSLLLGCHRQFFCVRAPDIIINMKNKNCQSEQDVDQFLYSSMDGQQYQNKLHADTMPKQKPQHVFMFSSYPYLKSASGAVQYCMLWLVRFLISWSTLP